MESVTLLSVVIILIGQLVPACSSANILYISSVASPSHFLWWESFVYLRSVRILHGGKLLRISTRLGSQQLFERLAEMGHNVTVLNLYKHGVIRGVHLIKLDGIIDHLTLEEEDYMELGRMNPFEVHISFFDLEFFVCERVIRSKGFLDLLNYPDLYQFRLVVHDHMAGPCLLTLLSRFNYPPLVLASAYNRLTTTATSLGSLIYPGFIPNQVNDIDVPMNFCQRMLNFLIAFWELFYKEFIYHPRLNALLKNQLNQTKSVSSLEEHTALVILNSIPVLEPPEPKLANIIQAGGLHIKSAKPLPPDLFDIVEKSPDGVILFSLGTNVRSDHLASDILREMITAMRNLSALTFLWKFESDGLVLPPNVITSAWFPQNDLLSHPKMRLSITHGGLLSVQEAAWHGVPLLGIPIYGDQFGNVNQMVEKGTARRLSLSELTAQQLQDCIVDMISTQSSYKKNAMLLSKVVRDQKDAPLDRATWSIEWVLRNTDTRDLWHRSLTSYGLLEKHSFDVVIVFVGSLVAGVGLVLLIINCRCWVAYKCKTE